MDKKELMKLGIGGLGLFYVLASVTDPANKAKYEDCADGASTIVSTIPSTNVTEFTLVDHEGNSLVTSDGQNLVGREIVPHNQNIIKYGVDGEIKLDVHMKAFRDLKVVYPKG